MAIFEFGSSKKSTKTSNTSALDRTVGIDKTTFVGKEIADEAVDKIIQDVLGSASGLASLVGLQGEAGVFQASASKDLSEGFLSKVIGDIAALKAKDVTREEGTETEEAFQEELNVTRKKKSAFGLSF